MRYIWLLIIFLFLPLLLAAEDAGITYTVKPELKQEASVYFLSVQGTTNLPDGALLDITFTYRFPGSDNERYLDYERCPVKGGSYETRLGPLRRRPASGEYLFKVNFDPDRQPDAILKNLESKYKGLTGISKTEVLTIGASSEDAPKERRQMMAIIQKEGLALKSIFEDIKGHYHKYLGSNNNLPSPPRTSGEETFRPEDSKALAQWSKETVGKLESLVKSILLEDELRVFESVTQAKASIENSAFLLKSLLQKLDGLQAFKEQPPKDEAEHKRQLAILTEEISGLYKLTVKEVLENLKDLGIFSLDKKVLIASLGKIEAIISRAQEDKPLKDEDKAVIMQEIVALSQNLPDMFYDELHQLVSDIINVLKSNAPIVKQAKDGIIQKIKTLRSEIETTTNY
ncbi:MAG: hypothetical protein AB1599_07785 [Planctomycetota bacterium]